MSKGEATRQAILDRASELASRLGLEGLTIGTLASDLGLSKSGLFAHFRSKEALQVQVLEHIAERFVELVVKPAVRAPRGEPRVRELFERVIDWPKQHGLSGSCPLLAAVSELDDRPGPARELIVKQQRDWLDTIATVVRTALAEKHFRAGVDPEQFAYEFYGLECAYHMWFGLLADPSAEKRARAAFEALIERCRNT